MPLSPRRHYCNISVYKTKILILLSSCLKPPHSLGQVGDNLGHVGHGLVGRVPSLLQRSSLLQLCPPVSPLRPPLRCFLNSSAALPYKRSSAHSAPSTVAAASPPLSRRTLSKVWVFLLESSRVSWSVSRIIGGNREIFPPQPSPHERGTTLVTRSPPAGCPGGKSSPPAG